MKVSVVTTLYYSEKYIDEFYARVRKAVLSITADYEIIFVNDGSPDNSLNKVLAIQQEDERVVALDLSRNFGHHYAIREGLKLVAGDYVFLIDCDLEEAPELLLDFWAPMMEDPVDVVYGVQRNRKGGVMEQISGKLFYWVMNTITSIKYPMDTLTARLMNYRYVQAVLKFEERVLDIWGVFVLAGFNQKAVIATKKSKGTSTYTFKRKVKLATEIITSFSHRPLYFIFFLGLIWFFISLANVFYIIIKKNIYGDQIEGWASILASIWLIGGVIILLLGVISIYLSKMFLEIKGRPSAIIKSIYRK